MPYPLSLCTHIVWSLSAIVDGRLEPLLPSPAIVDDRRLEPSSLLLLPIDMDRGDGPRVRPTASNRRHLARRVNDVPEEPDVPDTQMEEGNKMQVLMKVLQKR